MSVIIGNEKDFESYIQNDFVLVDFYATWCGPCKMLGPVLEEIATERSEVKIVKMDVDENSNIAKTYGIMSVPTMILFKNGKQVAKQTGFMPKELINDWLASHS